MAKNRGYPVLLVDSECAVCNRSVRFIRGHLKKSKKILFRSLFSPEGKEYLAHYNLPPDYNESLVLIENGKAYLKSDAVLRVSLKMGGLFPLIYLLSVLPRRIRDFFYSVFAKHRHSIGRRFGLL